VDLGKRLQSLHLLEAKELQDPANVVTTYPIAGDNIVGKRKHDGDKLWINDTQYIGNVSNAMWQYQIGGYPVAEKWLKDRRGRALSADEIRHIQQVLTAVSKVLEVTSPLSASQSATRRQQGRSRAAKRPSRASAATGKRSPASAVTSSLSRADRDAIRKWSRSAAAKKAGIRPVAARGRIPARTIEAWQAAR